jgi:type IV secretory pathway VirB9-like protein
MTYRINDNGTDRDMTPAEAAAYEQDAAAAQAAAAARAAAEEAAVAAKAALGLTEEEINALTGGI